MGPTEAKYERIFGRGKVTERLVFFSDAVFAIALTLLVIDLRVPEIDNGETSGDVILGLWPNFLAFFISFSVIAINWSAHHRKFRVIKEMNGTLLVINFVLLFLIAFVPFPTSLISQYPGEVASVVLYASVVSALNLVQLWMWVYAYRRGMVDAVVEVDVYRYVVRSLLIAPIVFGASILIALFWDPGIAMYFWFVLIPASIIGGRLAGRTRIPKPVEKTD